MKFTKMVASGNDFVVAGIGNSKLAKLICNRKYGIGADGLLVVEKSKSADIKMRIFNADGSEAEMCGNGARCAAIFESLKIPACRQAGKSRKLKVSIETKAGVIESEIEKDNVRIRFIDPKDLKLGIPLKINGRSIKVNFINTGVPHTVVFTQGLAKIDVFNIGRQLRYHAKFLPRGTNVDFVEVIGKDTIKVRTYERGVEDETLACGTGSAAAALIFASCDTGVAAGKVNVQTQGGEVLKVYFEKIDRKFKDVWLEGKAKIVYRGEYYV